MPFSDLSKFKYHLHICVCYWSPWSLYNAGISAYDVRLLVFAIFSGAHCLLLYIMLFIMLFKALLLKVDDEEPHCVYLVAMLNLIVAFLFGVYLPNSLIVPDSSEVCSTHCVLQCNHLGWCCLALCHLYWICWPSIPWTQYLPPNFIIFKSDEHDCTLQCHLIQQCHSSLTVSSAAIRLCYYCASLE